MTSRRSSGSMRADRAVEPTRSENITVTLSALRAVLGGRFWTGRHRCLALRDSRDWRCTKLSDCSQHSPAMPKRHAKSIKVLIRQFAENVDIDVALGKALG